MGNNNFETKHPRAKDGKFTEKARKESGLELSVEKPFTPPDTPEGCERGQVFVGEVKRRDSSFLIGDMTEYEAPSHDEVLDGDWWLVEKTKYESGGSGLIYRTPDGFVQEFYDKEGKIEEQDFLDKNFLPTQDAESWTEKQWYANGKLAKRTKNVIPESDEGLEFLKEDIEDGGGKLTVAESFYYQGWQDGQRYYRVKDGELYDVKEIYDKDGDMVDLISLSFDGVDCAPENEPCYYAVKDGVVQVAQYKVRRGGESVYHRTDGPASIAMYAPEGQRERYFLEGKEYTKAEWEKKVGR